MWSLHALQHVAKITFTTASPVDWDKLNSTYGTQVSPERIELLPAPRLPGVTTGTSFAYWQRAWFERFCSSVSGRFDTCISAYNPIRFSRPAIQLIGDFSFNEEARLDLYPNASEQAHHRPSLLRRLYVSVGEQLAGRTDTEIAGSGDWVVANSRWTAAVLSQRFHLPDSPILYPPSSLQSQDADDRRDPLGFVCMGRITPEKEVETIIGILDRVRSAGHAVTLDLVGHFGGDEYSAKIRSMAEERSKWIRLTGFLDPQKKEELFSTRNFGIHACRVEAFGIAVAEMAAAGLIPFVPADGGVGEIVGRDQLIFRHAEDAAEKICRMIESSAAQAELRRSLRTEVTRFRPERFAENLVEIVQDFMGRDLAKA